MTNDPLVGAVFGGRWHVERPLSSGGMGSVYVARHANTGRMVALKVIKSDGVASPEFAARFTRETQALAALSHPNVVTFLDSGCDHGQCFLVMELLQGRSLRALMGAPIDWRRAFRIGADLCRGLAAVHKQNLVHRDLKPENVFLQDAEGHDEIAKLIDFGIVRLQEGWKASTAATSTGAVVGTPGYISPEQLQGQHATATSDVYAIGVMLYELVTGRFPFEASTPHAMLVKQLIEPLQPPRNVLSTVPAHVEKVIQHFMERDPALRSRSALEALAELQEALKLVDSLPPDAATETGEEVGTLARQVMAIAASPASRPTATTGTVAPVMSPARAAPARRSSAGVGLALAIVVLASFSMCATCVVIASLRDDTEPASDAETSDFNVRVDGVSPEAAVRLEEQARALQDAQGAGDVAHALGGLADTVGDVIEEGQAEREAARTARKAARVQRPSPDEAKAIVMEQLDEIECEGDPPPLLKRIEFSLASGRVRLLTPTRNNLLLQCVARAAEAFEAPAFPGKPVIVVIKYEDVY